MRSRSPVRRCASRALSRPRPDEEPFRELKLLVDHRDEIVDERRRVHQRLRWHLHQLDPTFAVPLRMLARSVAPGARQPLARPPGARTAGPARARARRPLPRARPHDRRTRQRTRAADGRRSRRRCSSCPAAAPITAAKVLAEIGPIDRFKTTPNSHATAASRHSKRAQAASNAIGSTAAATANSTPRSTGSRSPKPATTRPHAPTSNANKPRARADAKRSAASNDNSPRRLQHTESEPRLDIGATLAQPWAPPPDRRLCDRQQLVDDERKRELKRQAREQEKAVAQQAMLLDEDGLNELLDHLDALAVEARCDHSLRLTRAWAAERGVDPDALADSLQQFGGDRDCEVLANVDPDAIF